MSNKATNHFRFQRLTAIANIPLSIFIAWVIASLVGREYNDVSQCIQNPVVAVLMSVAIASIAWHMKLGAQVIIEDYTHGSAEKILHLINSVVAAIIALAGISAVIIHIGT